MDGIVQDEIVVASTELAIEWNDLDPSLILLTAFIKIGHLIYFFITERVESIWVYWRLKIHFPNGYGEDTNCYWICRRSCT